MLNNVNINKKANGHESDDLSGADEKEMYINNLIEALTNRIFLKIYGEPYHYSET